MHQLSHSLFVQNFMNVLWHNGATVLKYLLRLQDSSSSRVVDAVKESWGSIRKEFLLL